MRIPMVFVTGQAPVKSVHEYFGCGPCVCSLVACLHCSFGISMRIPMVFVTGQAPVKSVHEYFGCVCCTRVSPQGVSSRVGRMKAWT